ncbi:MAG: MerR family transcriptional regulator, partial [Ktedonobacterales bacterium]
LTKRTLRYYEEIGLLAPPTRTEGGYRLYSAQDVQHLLRIKRLRDLLGFSLAEIREIAELEEYREQAKAAWEHTTEPQSRLDALNSAEEVTRRHLHMVEEKLAGLEEMRHALGERLGHYEHTRADLHAQIASANDDKPVH